MFNLGSNRPKIIGVFWVSCPTKIRGKIIIRVLQILGGLGLGLSGVDPGFQVRQGVHLKKKLRRAEEGAEIFGVFRVINHNFMPKNHIFSNFMEGLCPPPPGSAPGYGV